MCGINGFNFNNEKLIRLMNDESAHRGPDADGVFFDDGITFGHKRLSIIDLSQSAGQPMKSNDGRYVIIFNGEIYNFEELKAQCTEYQFKTQGDTEVILAAYAKWGKKCVEKFNGIFAFAIWDCQKKELFLARDQAGTKPLYYYFDGTKFIFSSEIKSILTHDIPRTLNKEAFLHYLRVLYTPCPTTMFLHVHKFPPQSRGYLNGTTFTIEKFEVEKKGFVMTGSHKDLVQETVMNSVKRQMVSDRPLGIYLSGGIDSSVLLAAASSIRSNIDTFSIGFTLDSSEEEGKFNKDMELAKRTAAFFGTNHHEVFVDSNDAISLFEQAIWHMDEPISNPTVIAMMKLAEYTKQHVDVILTGDGGDELFGGYERYRLSLLSSYYQKIPKFIRNIINRHPKLSKLDTSPGIERFAQFLFLKDAKIQSVLKEPLDKGTHNFFEKTFFSTVEMPFENQFMNTDRQSWLIDEALMRTDKMSMAHGIEARVPFLDNEVIELSKQISLHEKVDMFSTKKILKEAFKDMLPKFLFSQPKRGWFSPGAKWLRHADMSAFAKGVLSPDYYKPTQKLFNWEEIAEILRKHQNKEEYNLTIIWALLTFQIWAKRYKIDVS